MAYEKYIKRDGKIYGPYLYHSKRVDGKVVSEYHGQKNFEPKKFLPLIIGTSVLAIVLVFFIFSNRGPTGNAILNLNANYEPGKTLDGKLKISLKEGELFPADSKLTVENGGKSYDFNLKDIISEPTSNGNFYVEGTNVIGSGDGFGIPGKKITYPDVNFVLSILTEQSSTNSNTENTTDSITPISTVETSNDSQTQTPGITGNVVAGFFSGFSGIFSHLTPTGNVVAEIENEVQGITSSEKPFTYTLQDRQKAELKPLSVKSRGKQINDNLVSVATSGNEVAVKTSYSETENGFGQNYIGQNTKEIVIELPKLSIVPSDGDLRISFSKDGNEFLSLKTVIKGQGSVTANQTVELVKTNTTLVAQNNSFSGLTIQENTQTPTGETTTSELTEQERNVLTNKFGHTPVEVKQTNPGNGFIMIRYQLGDYWTENSYKSDLGSQEIVKLMEQDRVKWLKDLAHTLSQTQKTPTVQSQSIGNFSI